MLKTIGIALVACGIAAAGFFYAAAEKKKTAALEAALLATEQLKSAVTRQLIPLDRAIGMMREQNPLFAQLMNSSDPTGREAMKATDLADADAEILLTLFEAIPRASSDSTAHFEAAQEQLRIRLAMQRKTVEQNAALYPKLGLLGGAAVFLLFL